MNPGLGWAIGLLLVLGALPVQCQTAIQAKPASVTPPPYETIGLVSVGPAYAHGDGDVRGRFHRVLLLYSGLAYDWPEVRIETLTYGDEACCRKVISAKTLDLNELSQNGIALPDAATTEMKLLRWQSSRAVVLALGKLHCTFAALNQMAVTVKCKE